MKFLPVKYESLLLCVVAALLLLKNPFSTKALALPPLLQELCQFATKEMSCPIDCISMRKVYGLLTE